MRSTSERGGRTRAYSPSAIFIWLAVVRRCRAAILTPASFLLSFSSSFTFSLFLFTFPSLLFHSSSIFTSSFFTVNHVTARVYRIDCIFADKYHQIRVVTKDQAADGSRWLFYKFLIFSNIFLIFYFKYFCVCECWMLVRLKNSERNFEIIQESKTNRHIILLFSILSSICNINFELTPESCYHKKSDLFPIDKFFLYFKHQ